MNNNLKQEKRYTEKYNRLNDSCHIFVIQLKLHLSCRFNYLHLFHSNFPSTDF